MLSMVCRHNGAFSVAVVCFFCFHLAAKKFDFVSVHFVS